MTPYEILGIPSSASDDEVRAAYRKLAMKHHPDRGGSPEAFQQVKDAYAKLKLRPCTDCNGKGTIIGRQGIFVTKTACPKCWRT